MCIYPDHLLIYMHLYIYIYIHTHKVFIRYIFVYTHRVYTYCVCVLPTSDFFNSVLPSVYYFLLPGIYINEDIFMAKIFGL